MDPTTLAKRIAARKTRETLKKNIMATLHKKMNTDDVELPLCIPFKDFPESIDVEAVLSEILDEYSNMSLEDDYTLDTSTKTNTFIIDVKSRARYVRIRTAILHRLQTSAFPVHIGTLDEEGNFAEISRLLPDVVNGFLQKKPYTIVTQPPMSCGCTAQESISHPGKCWSDPGMFTIHLKKTEEDEDVDAHIL